jgi:probable HAF family extracellular repeat protein
MACVGVLFVTTCAAQKYTTTVLGNLGNPSSLNANAGINSHGQIAGASTTSKGQLHAFLYTPNAGMRDLETLGGLTSQANGLNNAGTVVGWSLDANGEQHAFLYASTGGMQDLHRRMSAGGSASAAYGINDFGTIVGYATDRNGFRHAVLVTPSSGAKIDLHTLLPFSAEQTVALAVNNMSQVVGYAELGRGIVHAFSYDPNTHTGRDLGTFGGLTSNAVSINNHGLITGNAALNAASSHAFALNFGWTLAFVDDLGTLKGANSSATAVNDLGQVVGTTDTATGRSAFVWSAVKGMQDLNSLMPASTGLNLTEAHGINSSGQIVALGYDSKQQAQLVLLTPVDVNNPIAGASPTSQTPVAKAEASTPSATANAVSITSGPNLGTWPIGEDEVELDASGGNGTYTWSYVSGVIPPGLSLRTDVPSFFTANGKAGLIGIATTPGTYNFTLSVSSNGSSAQRAFTIKITGLTIKDPYTLPDAFVNSAYSYQLTALDNAGAVTWNYLSGQLPPGMSLSSSGLISGTPSAAGSYSANFNFTDGTDTTYRSVQINVYTVQITSPGVLPNATQNVSYNTTLQVSGGTQPFTFGITDGGLPSGLTLNSSTGAITGTPNGGPGKSWFYVTAADSKGNSYTKQLSIDVLSGSAVPPSVMPYGNLDDCTVGIECSWAIGVYNGGVAPYSWSVTGLPPGMDFRSGSGITTSYITPGDVELWGTPTAPGSYTIKVTVNDTTGLSATQVYSLKVGVLWTDPFMPNGTQGVPYSTTFRILGGVPPYTAVQKPTSSFPGTLPAGLSLNGLTVSGTPQESGSFNPLFLFADSASTPNTELLTQYPYFSGPAGTSTGIGFYINQYAFENHLYTLQLAACCAANYTWSVIAGSLPPGFTLSASGLLSGTSNSAGTYTFMVQATNSGNTADYGTRQITIFVTPLSVQNTGTLAPGNVNVAYSVTLGASGAAGAVTWTLSAGNSLPPGLSLNRATGVISGTPSANGTYYFSVVATDSAGNADIGYFNISIYPNGSNPALQIITGSNLGTYSIGEEQIAFIASGGNGTYTWSVAAGSSLPPGLALRTDVPSWFPSNAYVGVIGVATTPGTYKFTLQAASAGQTVSRVFTLRVTGLTVMENSCDQLPPAFVGVAYTYKVTALNPANPNGTYANGAVTYTPTYNIPPGLTLNSDGTLAGTPTQAGYYTFNYNISDGVDTVNMCTSLNISLVEIMSPGSLPNATQGSSYSYTFTASGGTGSYTFTVNNIPAGLTLNSDTGVLSGTVTQGPGLFTFNLTATDTNNVSYTKTMSLLVIGVPATLPFIGTFGNFDDCTIGMICSRGLFVANGGTAPFTWNITGLPTGMSFRFGDGNTVSNVAPGDVEIWGAPLETGTFTITATVTDVNGVTSTQSFPLNVKTLFIDGKDSPPPGTVGTAYVQHLRVLGGSATPTYTAQIMRGVLPAGLSLNGMTVSGTPVENGYFSPDYLFTDTSSGSTLKITEGYNISGGTSTLTAYVTYLGLPSGGSVTDILSYYPVGSHVSYQLGACCAPSYVWSFVSGTLPPGLALSSSGLITGVANTAGTYTFLVKVTDGTNPANYSQRQYTIVVAPYAITGNPPYGNVGTLYDYTFTSTTAVTFSLAPGNYLPPGLTLSPSGELKGTPTTSGRYYFFVQTVDGSNNVSLTSFTINIYPTGGYPPLYLPIGPNLGPYTFGSLTIALDATGGVAPYHYSLTPGTSTPYGVRLQDGPPLPTNFGTATGGIIGVVTSAGSYNFSVRVTDSAGNVFDKPVTLIVSPLQVMSLTNLPNATLNTAYPAYTMTGNGGSGNYAWSVNGSLPPGMTLSSAGVLSGTPTQAGTFFPVVTLTDIVTQNAVGWTFTLVVDPFAITNGNVLPIGTQNSAYPTQTFTAPNCGAKCTWSIIGSYPSGLSLSSGGVLSGTPTFTYNGTINVQASGSNGTVQKLFAIVIVNSSQTLGINNGSTFGDITFGNHYSIYLSASGGTPPYAWSVVDPADLPPGITLQSPGDALASNLVPGGYYLAGRGLQTGTFHFTVQVTDAASHTATLPVTWKVSPLSFGYYTLPLAGTNLVYNSAYSQQLLAFGGCGSYPTWSVAAGSSLPPGLSLNAATGVISGTPTNTGSFNSGIQVTDGCGNTIIQYVTLNVASPSGVSISFGAGPNLGAYASGGTPLVFNLNPSGGTAPYTVTALSSLPSGCAVVMGNELLTNSSGSYDLYCEPLATGNFSFTLQAQDANGNIGVRTFNITFAPQTLYTSTSLANGSVGTAYSQPLLSWDNAGTVTWSIASGSSLPPGMSLTGSTIGGTPTTAGNYSFTLTAADSTTGDTINYTFSIHISTITITSPSILPVQAVFNESFSYQFTVSGGGSTKTWSSSNSISGLSLNANTGVLSGIPQTTGTFTFTISVTDGSSTVSKLFTLYIVYPDPALLTIPQSTALPDARVGQNYTAQSNPTGGTPPYTWSVAPGSNLPPGLSLYTGSVLPQNVTPGATLLGGEPTTAGSYSFDLTVKDNAGNTLTRTYTLNVASVAILAGALPNVITGTAYSAQLTSVGGTPPYTYIYSQLGINTPMFPAGISASSTGLISGMTSSTGIYQFYVTMQDSAGHTFKLSQTLNVITPDGLQVNTPTPFGLTVGGGYANELTVTGATGPLTWTVSAGSLPAGLALIPNYYGDNNTALVGSVTTPGAYNYTLHAVDANGHAADRAYTVTVLPMQLPHIISGAGAAYLPVATEGSAYSYSYNVAGGTPPYTFAESAIYPLPAGLTLQPNGTLTGMPAADSGGRYLIYFTLTDSQGYSGPIYGGTLLVVPAGSHAPLYQTTQQYLAASVNTPFFTNLDAFVGAGVPPYAWSVAAGSALPAGVSLVPGANGTPNALTGVVTAAGTYIFNLNVTDSAGQTTLLPVTLFVKSPSIAAQELPNGLVGTAYSAQVSASGGTPPYTFQFDEPSNVPPGLSINANGVISGTPAYPGLFSFYVLVTDSAGNATDQLYTVVIDNAAGQAPGVSINPGSVQVTYTLTAAQPAPVPLSINFTSGSAPFTATVEGIPGASLSVTSGSGNTTSNLTLTTTGLAVGTYNGFVVVSAPQTVNSYAAVPVTLTVANAPPCTYSLTPNSGSVPAAGGSGSFSVSTGPTCAWTPSVSDPGWISVTSGSGPGSGTVNYTVTQPNNNAASRTGTITVAGQQYTITQFGSGCAFSVSPTSLTIPSAATTVQFNVTASAGGCSWSASGYNATPANGTGNGVATLTIPQNTNGSTLIRVASIAGQQVEIFQTGVACTASLNPASVEVPASGATNNAINVTIPQGCLYVTSNPGPSWITINSGASGEQSGQLLYSVAPNTSTMPRTGTMNIGGATFQITQDGLPCSVTVDASHLPGSFATGGDSGTIYITANGPNCSWTASSPVPWATLSTTSGTGNGSTNVLVGSNASSSMSRSAALTIASQTVGITQSGTTCSYALSSPNGSVPASGGNGSVGVTAPAACGWSSSSSDPTWLTITYSGNAGSSSVQFTAAANTTSNPRSASLTIADQTYTVTEAGLPCAYTLSSTSSGTISSGGASSSFTYTSSGGNCTDNAASYSAWLSATTTPGANGGTVNFIVAPNPNGATRTGTIQLGSQIFTVVQSGATCAFSLNAYASAFNLNGGSGAVQGSPSAMGCSPTVGSSEPFVTLGNLSGPTQDIFTLPYTVSPFVSATAVVRKATITFGGQIYVVKQTSW